MGLKKTVWGIDVVGPQGLRAQNDVCFGETDDGKPALQLGDNIITGEGGGGGSAELYAEITYDELCAKVEAGQLQPGMLYRITDYVTTVPAGYTITVSMNDIDFPIQVRSAGKPFDIVVKAVSNNQLDEDARAVEHGDNQLFPGIARWTIKYALKNERYRWSTASNSKGIIYYLKDEFDNECGYDFKNIQYYMPVNEDSFVFDTTQPFTMQWVYTFSNAQDDYSDASLNTGAVPGDDYVHNVRIRPYEDEAYELNAIMTLGVTYDCSFGNGCFAILFGNWGSSMVFGEQCENIMLHSGTQNVFGNFCGYIVADELTECTFEDHVGDIYAPGKSLTEVFFGRSCSNIMFGETVGHMRFEPWCENIEFRAGTSIPDCPCIFKERSNGIIINLYEGTFADNVPQIFNGKYIEFTGGDNLTFAIDMKEPLEGKEDAPIDALGGLSSISLATGQTHHFEYAIDYSTQTQYANARCIDGGVFGKQSTDELIQNWDSTDNVWKVLGE